MRSQMAAGSFAYGAAGGLAEDHQELVVDDNSIVSRHMFYDLFYKMLQEKRQDNNFFFTNERYESVVREVKIAKAKKSGKQVRDYRRIKRFDVIKVRDEERLVVPHSCSEEIGLKTIQYYVKIDEIYDILHETHLRTGHGGRTRMVKELQTNYKNITYEIITLYLRLCKRCQISKNKGHNYSQKPFKQPHQNTVEIASDPRPISKCSVVHFIDFRHQPDQEYHFVLVYEDELTKFVQIRQLKSVTSDEISRSLLEIMLLFGVPRVLRFTPEIITRETVIGVISNLCNTWHNLIVIYDKSNGDHDNNRLNETSGTVFDLHQAILNWMEENSSGCWSKGIHFVQYFRNIQSSQSQTFDERSPFENMFGRSFPVVNPIVEITFDEQHHPPTEEPIEELDASSVCFLFPDHQELF